MSVTIYYFSATGNSLEAAKVISKELQGTLLPMTLHRNAVCNDEVIGFVYPTFFWGMPNIVEEFIKSLDITSANPYLFAVTTCTMISGAAVGSLNKLLLTKGHSLQYGKTIRSVPNYIVEYNVNLEKVPAVLDRAKEKALLVATDVTDKKKNHIRHVSVFSKIFHRFYKKRTAYGYQNFWITNNCVGCGMCKKVCPRNNISMEDGKPMIHNNCEHCIACVHWCPQHAIQYKNKTQNRNRYHNPHVTIKELNH